MDPFALLDDDADAQINFAQAIEALATGDPERVRTTNLEWRLKHAVDYPPCWELDGWKTAHGRAAEYLWPHLITGKARVTTKDGEPIQTRIWLEDRWAYVQSMMMGTPPKPLDEDGRSLWYFHNVFDLFDAGVRVSAVNILALIRARDLTLIRSRILTLIRSHIAAPVETPVEVPQEPPPPPARKPRRPRVKKQPIEEKPVEKKPPPVPSHILGGASLDTQAHRH